MTERDKRYAQTEKGRAARARAQAKWRKSKRGTTPSKKPVGTGATLATRLLRKGWIKFYGVPTREWYHLTDSDRAVITNASALAFGPQRVLQAKPELSDAEKRCRHFLACATSLTHLFSGALQVRKVPQFAENKVKTIPRPVCLLNEQEQGTMKGLLYQLLSKEPHCEDVLRCSVFPWFLSLDPLSSSDKLEKLLTDACESPVRFPEALPVPLYPETFTSDMIQKDRRKRAEILLNFLWSLLDSLSKEKP